MPLVLHAIRSVEIGSISMRKVNAPRQLDSYQDEELQCLRHEWLDLIEKRKLYLESEIKVLSEQTGKDHFRSQTHQPAISPDKTPNDVERERALLEQLIRLAEERNFAEFPPPGSGIPGKSIFLGWRGLDIVLPSGSPPCWTPPATIEEHRPLIFLNLDPVNMNSENDTAGLKATLNEENKNDMFRLPLLHHASDEVRTKTKTQPSHCIHLSLMLLGTCGGAVGPFHPRSHGNVSRSSCRSRSSPLPIGIEWRRTIPLSTWLWRSSSWFLNRFEWNSCSGNELPPPLAKQKDGGLGKRWNISSATWVFFALQVSSRWTSSETLQTHQCGLWDRLQYSQVHPWDWRSKESRSGRGFRMPFPELRGKVHSVCLSSGLSSSAGSVETGKDILSARQRPNARLFRFRRSRCPKVQRNSRRWGRRPACRTSPINRAMRWVMTWTARLERASLTLLIRVQAVHRAWCDHSIELLTRL